MQKKVLTSIVGPLIGLCFFHCSSLDDYTGLGANIIEDSDPSLMNFGDNFFPVALDSSRSIDTVFSLPGTSTSGFGKHSGKLAAGNSDGFDVYGYVAFPIPYAFTKSFDPATVFDSIVFVFDPLLDTIHTTKITAQDTLKLFSCVDSTTAFQGPPAADSSPLCTLRQHPDSVHWVGTLADSVLEDSIFSHCRKIIDTTDKGKTTAESEQDLLVYTTLTNSSNNVVWFKTDAAHLPTMVFHTHYTKRLADSGDTVINKADTLRNLISYPSYPAFIATESDSLITANGTKALSSWLPGRIAVFKLDCKPLWDTIRSTGFHELLSAGFAVKGKLLLTDNNDSSPSVNYFLAKELYSDIDSIKNQLKIANDHYSYELKLKHPDDTADLILPVDYPLQHFVDGSQRYFYLYLRLTSNAVIWNQEVRWSQPRFKAVLTTIN